MITARSFVADGPAGIAKILSDLTALKEFYGATPQLRRAALAIARPQIDNDQLGQLAALARFVKVSVVYVNDPLNSEFIVTPGVMLAAILRDGTVPGDCDDHALLFCSLAEALGIPCDIAGVAAPGSPSINHVIAVAHLPTGDLQIDLCAKSEFQPVYPEFLILPA